MTELMYANGARRRAALGGEAPCQTVGGHRRTGRGAVVVQREHASELVVGEAVPDRAIGQFVDEGGSAQDRRA